MDEYEWNEHPLNGSGNPEEYIIEAAWVDPEDDWAIRHGYE